MKLMLTTNGRLYKNSKNEYFTPMVYGYGFFKKYLEVFEEVRLVAHVELTDKDLTGMLRVDGQGLEIYDVAFPHGKIEYIKSYLTISRQLKAAPEECDAAIFRIPDQLAFQAMPKAKQAGLPIGVEVTSNSWEFFEKGAVRSALRPFIRRLWDWQQKKACKEADASCYVTQYAIQKRYPPAGGNKTFSTYCSDVDITVFRSDPRNYGRTPMKKLRCIHISGSIAGKAKGHGELLNAMGILKDRGLDIECVLIGGGRLDGENENIILSKLLNVERRGLCSTVEIAEEMKKADMFVFPSYREGLPRVVVEAMAAGLVCVATNLDGIRELLDESVLVPVKDPVRLAEVIYNLAKHPDLMTAQSRRNVQEAERYSTERMTERRNSFYGFLYDRAGQKDEKD